MGIEEDFWADVFDNFDTLKIPEENVRKYTNILIENGYVSNTFEWFCKIDKDGLKEMGFSKQFDQIMIIAARDKAARKKGLITCSLKNVQQGVSTMEQNNQILERLSVLEKKLSDLENKFENHNSKLDGVLLSLAVFHRGETASLIQEQRSDQSPTNTEQPVQVQTSQQTLRNTRKGIKT